MGLEPTRAGTTIRCVNQTSPIPHHTKTGIAGVEPALAVLETDVLPLYYIPMVVGSGFEPPNPKERIYSPPRLARLRYPTIMARDGIEPPTHGASIRCSTN